jgi:hypothetical protein
VKVAVPVPEPKVKELAFEEELFTVLEKLIALEVAVNVLVTVLPVIVTAPV